MITKNIDFDGYNRAIIEKLYDNEDMVCTVQEIAVDEAGSETIVKQDTNLVFPAGSIQLTPEEIAELRPNNQEQTNIE